MPAMKNATQQKRKFAIGAEVQPGGGVHFRVWAPRRNKVCVVFPDDVTEANSPRFVALHAEDNGYYSGFCPTAKAGDKYAFLLDDDQKPYPDPMSRFQPEGPHGYSQIIDPSQYAWRDEGRPGFSIKGQVIYEMHIGTFTRGGTWATAIEELPALAELGITLLEVMPVADFPHKFGWGYDGVNLFAPTRLYGEPDDMRRFVDAAHALGMGVILDVVYNHFGPDGNYLAQFSEDYISKQGKTDWGEAINFDGPNSKQVREFFYTNAAYWIAEFHLDGFRLDAVHAIFDRSGYHILQEIEDRVRKAAGGRETIMIVENEFQDSKLLKEIAQGGHGIDAAWNDDFHHAARVAMTGHSDYYYGDYRGTPQELISAVKWGYLYQGQWNMRQKHPRGTPGFRLPGYKFVHFLQNHDQVGNTPGGHRYQKLTSPGRLRALTALLLLGPSTPMLFQGQEFNATTPFHYFADHEPEVSKMVRQGRVEFMRLFRRLGKDDANQLVPDPCAPETFAACKLDFAEREKNGDVVLLHRDLLRLRREDPIFAAQDGEQMHGAVLAPEALLLRFFGENDDDRVLIVNLGNDFEWIPTPEPLMAPPEGKRWERLWSSEEPDYGGSGSGIHDMENLWFPGHSAVVLKAVSAT